MRRRMIWALLLFGCLGLGIRGVYAAGYTWNNGDTVSGLYWVDNTNTMTINGDITIDGDVTIANTQGAPESCHYFPIYITANSFLHPEHDSSKGYGHLVFYNGNRSSGMFVYVDNDLIFTGSNHGDKDANNRELTLTFSGPGQVVFHIANKKQVGFEGFFGNGLDSGTLWNNYWDDYTKTGSGVMAYVTMDQTYNEAVEDGVNKVVFERYYAYDSALVDPTTSGTQDSVKISIGKNSFLTYISDIETGLLDCNDTNSGYGSIAFDPMCYGPGRMLLHIKGSNYVNSSGTVVGLPHAYNDGALVVAGHYVTNYTTSTGILTGVSLNKPAGVEAILRIIDEQAWRNTTYYQYEAGQRLYRDGTTSEPVLNGGDFGGMASRRGLLVLNENKSVPSYAADTYVNNEWHKQYIFSTKNLGSTSIRPGFILGVNGNMELFHNTFLDYVAGSTMVANPNWVDQYGTTLSNTLVKKHNPSALTVDGLGILNIANFDASDPYNSSRRLYPFRADDSNQGGRHAQMLLRGDSRIYLRSGVRNDGFISSGDSLEGSGGLGGYLIGTDRLYSFTVNWYDTSNLQYEGTYDGSFMAGRATNGGLYYETSGEGNHVLDVEGKLTVRSTADKNQTNESGFVTVKLNRDATPSSCFARHVPLGETYGAARGALNVPPLKLDYMGQEVSDDLLNRAQRPLTVNNKYLCYNSSSLFLNDEISMHNINWYHNDLLKVATPEQDKAEPAVVGGEKASFDYTYWSTVATNTANTLYVENPIENINTKVPLISMFNSTLECHESIVATGVRFVVAEDFWYSTTDSLGHVVLTPNTSHIICYNHGDPLDMLKRGYGRTVLLGTQQSKMADGETVNAYLQDAYLSIYRGWNTDGNAMICGDGDYLIRLSLESDAQPKYVAQYADRTNSPSTFSNLVLDGVDQYKRAATQVFFLGNGSYSSLGWTTTMANQVFSLADMRARVYGSNYSYTFGINEGFRPRPWDAVWGQAQTTLDGSSAALADFKFSLTSDANDPGELYINGDNYYFGGRDASGNKATEPVVAANEASIWYVNHGGKIHINQSSLSVDQQQYFDCFVDTIFAYRGWPRIWSVANNAYIDGLAGIIDLPHDQVKFGRSIQPYNLDFPTMLQANDGQTKERNVRLSVYDEKNYGVEPVKRHKASGEEVTIPWNFRTDKSVKIGHMEVAPTFTPVKSLNFYDPQTDDAFRYAFRTTKTGQDIGPADMPEAVLTVSTGDVIQQMRVSGATKADPFHLYVTGGHQGYGVVREFTTLASNYFNPGEGAHAAIMLDGGAHIGLGDRHWNEHSRNAWCVLGHDYITLYPNGNAMINVNSDLFIADRLPIMPTDNFGSHSNIDQVATFKTSDQRLTFYSDVPREIRIPEGGEFDLSAFGRVPTNPVSMFPQQIEFAGKIRLVLEAGAKIRFPSGLDVNGQDVTHEAVLYFNDESELIFEGAEDRDESRWSNYIGGDAVRTKIMGIGQIWLNKDAKMKINGTALVGVETDDETVTTSISISINRQAGLFIGSDTISGGALQIGNPVDRDGTIDFTLRLDGPKATVKIAREGFLGFATGTINKQNEPNDDGWRVNGLYDVNRIYINLIRGTFDHSQIFDGDDSRSSILGIGPLITGNEGYQVTLGEVKEAIIKGGGNLLYVAASGDIYPNTGGADGNGMPPHGVTLAGSTASIAGGTTGNYTMMASTASIRQLSTVANGTGTITAGPNFTGNPQAFYNYVGFISFGGLPTNYATYGISQNEERIGYIVGTTITRTNVFAVADNTNPEFSLNVGALTATVDVNNDLIAVKRGY